MVSNPNEKWMEYCELAAKEQNPKKLIALMAEIGRLLRERADAAREESATSLLKILVNRTTGARA